MVSPIFELEMRKPFLKQIDREFTGLLKLMQFAQIKLPSSGILHNVLAVSEPRMRLREGRYARSRARTCYTLTLV